MASPFIALNNGVEMPALGLGVYQSGAAETIAAVRSAIALGYRMIDTAAAYGNEEQVGIGIRETGIERDKIFVQTKLWMSDYGYDAALHGFERSMRKLGLETLDLYLLHWPVPKQFDATVASWRAAERLLAEGRTRAIGICNAAPADLARLLEQAEIVPAVNQVELHPYLAQPDVRRADRDRGIVTQAWSPIGGVMRYWGDADAARDPLTDEHISAIAARHGKTSAQVILRWHIQHGHSVIPKSVSETRIRENGDIFDFTLSEADMAAIDRCDRGARGGPDPAEVTPQLFNLNIED